MSTKKSLKQKVGQLLRSTFTSDGKEITSDHKREIPLKLRSPNQQQVFLDTVRQELDRRAAMAGKETYAESQDFDIDDENDIDVMFTRYEVVALQDEMIADEKYNPYHKAQVDAFDKQQELALNDNSKTSSSKEISSPQGERDSQEIAKPSAASPD